MKVVSHEGIHDSRVCDGNDDVTYLYRILPGHGDFAEVQDQSRGRIATLEYDHLALERQDLYPYVGNLLFFRGHIIDVLESAMTIDRRIDVRTEAADPGIAHELRRYQVVID